MTHDVTVQKRYRVAQNKRLGMGVLFFGPTHSLCGKGRSRASEWGPTGGGSPGGVPAGRPPAPLDAARLDDDVDLVAEAARGGHGGRGGGRHGAGPAVLAAAQLT